MFSADEQNLIARYSIAKGWDTSSWDYEGLNPEEVEAKKQDARQIESIKTKIRNHFIDAPSPRCCYCRRTMHEWDRLDIDTEHVLPKGKFPQWAFTILNLNIACKRCNMRKKNEDYSFFRGQLNQPAPFVSDLYGILHPNLDEPDKELVPVVIQVGPALLIKYYVSEGSAKAEETYVYFELKEVEVDSLSAAQGVDLKRIAATMPPPLAAAIEALIGADGKI